MSASTYNYTASILCLGNFHPKSMFVKIRPNNVCGVVTETPAKLCSRVSTQRNQEAEQSEQISHVVQECLSNLVLED